MSDRTKIEWTDATWNPIRGCQRISSGCDHCYAERMARRFDHDHAWAGARQVPEALEVPLHWRRPKRVFVASMGDLFEESIPYSYVDRVWQVMAACPQHRFLVLTKRATRLENFRPSTGLLPNVWLGLSVENQKTADERIPLLLQTPAAGRFVSVEPMLGWVDLVRACDCVLCGPAGFDVPAVQGWGAFLHWVICGGETGPGARPMNPYWVRWLRNQCEAEKVPFFFKSWGEWAPTGEMDDPQAFVCERGAHGPLDTESIKRLCADVHPHPCGRSMVYRVGKRRAGAALDGREWRQFPEVEP